MPARARSQMKRFFIADDDTSGMYAELDMKEFSDVSNLNPPGVTLLKDGCSATTFGSYIFTFRT